MELRRHSKAQRCIPLVVFAMAVIRFLALSPLLTEEELKLVANGGLTPDLLIIMIATGLVAAYLIVMHTFYRHGPELIVAFNFCSQLSQQTAGKTA